jgi:aspartyl-tRNA(Asn)/glutamyl-tRNA(Gln) amidotransferase subunit B
MQKGEMRVEANISVSNTDELGTKVEVKNLNSFKAVERSIDYEIERMTALHEAGRGDEIVQETRGWDDVNQKTFSQRAKETSDDYRYFPEPDLPKMELHSMFDLDELKKKQPELPWERREYLIATYSVDESIAQIFVEQDDIYQFMKAVTEGCSEKETKLSINYITSDLLPLVKENEDVLKNITVDAFKKLISMIVDNELSSRGAKDVLILMAEKGGMPDEIAEQEGLMQKSDPEEIRNIVKGIIAENESVVEEYKGGKEASLMFLVGQGMKATQGSANPQMLKELLIEEIKG